MVNQQNGYLPLTLNHWTQKGPRNMSMEVQAMEYYMHTNVAGLNRFDFDPPTPAIWNSKDNTDQNKQWNEYCTDYLPRMKKTI